MPKPPLSSENVSALIDHLLKNEDPALIGLRRILKNKTEQSREFPYKPLKLSSFESAGKGGSVFNQNEMQILKLEKRCNDLLTKIDGEKKNTEKQAKAAYEKGYKEGIQKGNQDGEQRAEEEYNTRLKDLEGRIAEILQATLDAKREALVSSRKLLLELSVLLARKVINTEISLNQDIILTVIKKALSYIVDNDSLVVRVAPEDYENVTKKKDFWTSVSERLDKVSIEPDDRISRGGCIIDSSSGVADARIDVQMEELRDLVKKVWEDVTTSNHEESVEDFSGSDDETA